MMDVRNAWLVNVSQQQARQHARHKNRDFRARLHREKNVQQAQQTRLRAVALGALLAWVFAAIQYVR